MARVRRDEDAATTHSLNPVDAVPVTERVEDFVEGLPKDMYLFGAGFLRWVQVTGRGSEKLSKQDWENLLRIYQMREVN